MGSLPQQAGGPFLHSCSLFPKQSAAFLVPIGEWLPYSLSPPSLHHFFFMILPHSHFSAHQHQSTSTAFSHHCLLPFFPSPHFVRLFYTVRCHESGTYRNHWEGDSVTKGKKIWSRLSKSQYKWNWEITTITNHCNDSQYEKEGASAVVQW